jgi:hypothetical protein
MNRIEELRAKYEAAREVKNALRAELEEAEEELKREGLKNIEPHIPYYEKRLKRLKVFIDAFLEEERGSDVKCAFKKQEYPYLDDFHEVMHDPLDWEIVEYDLLGMTKIMEIKIDYHTEAVKDFVEKWIKESFKNSDGWRRCVDIRDLKELRK